MQVQKLNPVLRLIYARTLFWQAPCLDQIFECSDKVRREVFKALAHTSKQTKTQPLSLKKKNTNSFHTQFDLCLTFFFLQVADTTTHAAV